MDKKPENASHLKAKFMLFEESKERLNKILERVQFLEVKLIGEKVSDLKDCSKDCNESPVSKPSILQDFTILTNDFSDIITNLNESVNHLEELI